MYITLSLAIPLSLGQPSVYPSGAKKEVGLQVVRRRKFPLWFPAFCGNRVNAAEPPRPGGPEKEKTSPIASWLL